jgi:hypothetical protein
MGKHFMRLSPMDSVEQGAPVLSLQNKVFQMSLPLYILGFGTGGVWAIPEMPSRHVSCFPSAKYLASF